MNLEGEYRLAKYRGLYNSNLNLLWIDVPRCASTWTRSCLAKIGGFDPVLFPDYPKNAITIAVTRDPIKRFISVSLPLSADLVQHQHLLETMSDQDLELLIQLKFHDINLAPQFNHFHNLDTSEMHLFWVDGDLTAKFLNYLQSFNIYIDAESVPVLNSSQNKAGYQAAIQSSWRRALRRFPHRVESLQRVYHQDYQWIQKQRDEGKFFDRP